jgi:hypothetical protein
MSVESLLSVTPYLCERRPRRARRRLLDGARSATVVLADKHPSLDGVPVHLRRARWRRYRRHVVQVVVVVVKHCATVGAGGAARQRVRQAAVKPPPHLNVETVVNFEMRR